MAWAAAREKVILFEERRRERERKFLKEEISWTSRQQTTAAKLKFSCMSRTEKKKMGEFRKQDAPRLITYLRM